MVRHERIYHRRHCDQCEQASADLADVVAEVEEADCQSAEDDGEVEPGEKGTFVGEEDFGFDSCGEGDTFSCKSG